jgi:hypothetical protein
MATDPEAMAVRDIIGMNLGNNPTAETLTTLAELAVGRRTTPRPDRRRGPTRRRTRHRRQSPHRPRHRKDHPHLTKPSAARGIWRATTTRGDVARGNKHRRLLRWVGRYGATAALWAAISHCYPRSHSRAHPTADSYVFLATPNSTREKTDSGRGGPDGGVRVGDHVRVIASRPASGTRPAPKGSAVSPNGRIGVDRPVQDEGEDDPSAGKPVAGGDSGAGVLVGVCPQGSPLTHTGRRRRLAVEPEPAKG